MNERIRSSFDGITNIFSLKERLTHPTYTIELLRPEDIASYRTVILNGINDLPQGALKEEYETNIINERTIEFYSDRLKNPEKYTLLSAKDKNGIIVGGIEAEIYQPNNEINVGHVNFICVNREVRRRGIAMKLYKAYENILLKRNDVSWIMAGISPLNNPSMRLHQKLGITQFYTKDEYSTWYYKLLR